MSKYGVICGPYFPVFGLNTEIYFVNLRIQSEYRKIRIRNNYVFGHFSRSEEKPNYGTVRSHNLQSFTISWWFIIMPQQSQKNFWTEKILSIMKDQLPWNMKSTYALMEL